MKQQEVIRTGGEGGEAAPLSLLSGLPCLGLGAGLPQRQGEVVGGHPGGTQQSHHVQAQRQEDAQQRDELERPEHVHLVHGHLPRLILESSGTRRSRFGSVTGTTARARWRSTRVLTHHATHCFVCVGQASEI